MRLAARAWPVPLILALSILVQKTFFESRWRHRGTRRRAGIVVLVGARCIARVKQPEAL